MEDSGLSVREEGLFSVLAKNSDALARMERITLRRGDVLMTRGSASDALYLVDTGRLRVERAGVELAELGAGTPVGEISFFTGEPRTADVIAARDTVVIRITQEEFADMSVRFPGLQPAIARFLAQRLATTSARVRPDEQPPMARTIAMIPAGDARLDMTLARSLGQAAGGLTVTRDDAHRAIGADLESAAATVWFNDLERDRRTVLFAVEGDDPDWGRRVLRQADQVLVVGAGTPPPLSELEAFAFSILPQGHRRLALVHPEHRQWVSGTAAWLDSRPVFLHHHLAHGAQSDVARLARFLTGTARGLVAAGGGALGPLHTGTFEAMRTRGLTFDIFGGTSVGSAMCAAFAMGLDGDDIDRRTGQIFVAGGALSTLTVPKYSLLDHTVFDRHLREHYTANDIEDLWYPYFAVATDLSDNSQKVIRRGPLWQAIRASAAIPGALPPFFDRDGSMLADGGAMDNLPFRTMHGLKDGPNVLISFARVGRQVFDVAYDQLPGRRPLLRRLLFPFGRKPPRAPGIVPVAMRALMARQAAQPLEIGPDDWLIRPPVPKGTGFMDWKKHRILYEVGRDHMASLLDDPATVHPAFAPLLPAQAA